MKSMGEIAGNLATVKNERACASNGAGPFVVQGRVVEVGGVCIFQLLADPVASFVDDSQELIEQLRYPVA